jgi:SAM-dependent methyltransferase
LLKESGRTGVGVDLTDQYVVSLREEGFSAIRQDVFEFLKSHPATFDGVFASHLIEHFPTQDALRLLELMYESLRSGGTLLLITPSYEDIIVSGERFWLDVSHVRPYPLQLLDAVLKHLGMEITDKGHEPSTRVRPKITSPRSFVRYWVAKLRFGKLYDVGDAFIVAKKPQGVVI